MNLLPTHSGERMAGVGCWEWFDPAQNQPDKGIRFDPTIRLAELAFVQGAGWFSANIKKTGPACCQSHRLQHRVITLCNTLP